MGCRNHSSHLLIALVCIFTISACSQSPKETALSRETAAAKAQRNANYKESEKAISEAEEHMESNRCDYDTAFEEALKTDNGEYFISQVSNLNCYLGEMPLLNAAIFVGMSNIVDALLKQGVKDSKYFPAATSAASSHQLAMLKKLQANNFSVIEADVRLKTPLEYALDSTTEDVIEHFKELNQELSQKSNDSKTVKPASVLSVVKYLIAQGADYQQRSAFGETPLMLARNFEVAEFLVAQGAYLNARDDNDFTVLMTKVKRESSQNSKIIQQLVDNKADINAMTNKEKRTALHWAAEYENIDDARLLINAGANLSLKDNKGNTPLMLAQKTNNHVLIKLFKTAETSKSESPTGAIAIKKTTPKNFKLEKPTANQPVTKEMKDIAKRELEAFAKSNACKNQRKLVTALKNDDVKYLMDNLTSYDCSVEKGVTPLLAAINFKAIKSSYYLVPLTKDSLALPAAVMAATNLDLDLLKLLKQHGYPLDGHFIDGKNAAYAAVKANYKRLARKSNSVSPTTVVLEFLRENGVNLGGANYRGETPLMKTKDPEVMHYLLTHGVDINAVDIDGRSALYHAVRSQRSNNVEILMWHKANTLLSSSEGLTVIDIAQQKYDSTSESAKKNAAAILKLLDGSTRARKPQIKATMAKCPQPKKIIEAIKEDNVDFIKNNLTNYQCVLEKRLTPFHLAHVFHKEKVFSFLASKVKEDSSKPVFVAVAGQLSNNFIKILLDNNFDINVSNQYGITPLLKAVEKSKSGYMGLTTIKSDEPIDVVKLLINNGADVHAKNNNGETALMLTSNTEVFDSLISKGLNINAVDNQGKNPLHHFDRRYKDETQKQLVITSIKNGIDLNAKDEEGMTVLHYAISRQDVKSLTIYLNYGGSWNTKDKQGKTPLGFAEAAINNKTFASSSEEKRLISLIEEFKKKAKSNNHSNDSFIAPPINGSDEEYNQYQKKLETIKLDKQKSTKSLSEKEWKIELEEYRKSALDPSTSFGEKLNQLNAKNLELSTDKELAKEEKDSRLKQITDIFVESSEMHKALNDKKKQFSTTDTKTNPVEKNANSRQRKETIEVIEVASYQPKKPVSELSKVQVISRIKELQHLATEKKCKDNKNVLHAIHEDNVSYFKENTVDFNCFPHVRFNLIGFATVQKSYKLLEYFADKVKDNPQYPIALLAAKQFDLKALSIIAKHNYSFDAYSIRGKTAVIKTLNKLETDDKTKQESAKKVIDFLVKHGANINQHGHGFSVKYPIMYARTDYMLEHLIKHDSDVSVIDEYSNTTLHLIMNLKLADEGLKMAKRLVEEGADIDAQDDNLRTPLMHAIKERDVNMVSLLLDLGADQEVRNKSEQDAQSYIDYLIKRFVRNKERIVALEKIKALLIKNK